MSLENVADTNGTWQGRTCVRRTARSLRQRRPAVVRPPSSCLPICHSPALAGTATSRPTSAQRAQPHTAHLRTTASGEQAGRGPHTLTPWPFTTSSIQAQRTDYLGLGYRPVETAGGLTKDAAVPRHQVIIARASQSDGTVSTGAEPLTVRRQCIRASGGLMVPWSHRARPEWPPPLPWACLTDTAFLALRGRHSWRPRCPRQQPASSQFHSRKPALPKLAPATAAATAATAAAAAAWPRPGSSAAAGVRHFRGTGSAATAAALTAGSAWARQALAAGAPRPLPRC